MSEVPITIQENIDEEERLRIAKAALVVGGYNISGVQDRVIISAFNLFNDLIEPVVVTGYLNAMRKPKEDLTETNTPASGKARKQKVPEVYFKK